MRMKPRNPVQLHQLEIAKIDALAAMNKNRNQGTVAAFKAASAAVRELRRDKVRT